LSDFKNIAAAVVKAMEPENLPASGWKWSAKDVVAVLAYAWLRGVCVDTAAEKLDAFAIHEGTHVPVTFTDGRESRAFPHQTSVNAWLRSLDLSAAACLAKAVFGAALKLARKRKLLPRQVVLEYDITLCGYFGRRRDAYIKGTTQLKGTKYARQYHAALAHGGGMSLFVALEHVAKGRSKVPFLLDTARWLKSQGFKAKWALVDRDYYRYGVIAGMKALGVDVITPAKNYDQLKGAKEDYLLGRKGRVQSFRLGTKNKKGAKTRYTRCWLMLYSDGSHPLDVLRGAVRRNLTSVAAAANEIFGLITTAAPQGHGRSFPDRILQLYRMRWQIETGFRVVDVHHCPWRSNLDASMFVDVLGRLVLDNHWQLARKEDPRGNALTLQTFRNEVVDSVTGRVNL
jgi:hypothetical protein